MASPSNLLSALEVSRLTRRGWHTVGGVPGLGLLIDGRQRSWILRFSFGGRRPEMGLGPFPEVSLAEARRHALEIRAQVRAGTNPIEARRAARSAEAARRAASKTFRECAAAFIKAKSPEWANAKHALQWSTTLATYADPLIGSLAVQDVDTPHILAVLEPIWLAKNETASRLRGRLENILDWAIARGYRAGPNPARWKGHLAVMLAAPGKVQKTAHRAALPYSELPAFMVRLRGVDGQGARALEFAILCASRSGEVRGVEWGEIDLARRVWIIPGARMKAGKEHRVPLSSQALALLRSQPRIPGSDVVFPSPRGQALSDMSLTAVTRRMRVDAVPHGFRSTFRTWAAEQTSFPREVIEMALAHAIESKVEEAYQRSDLLEKRARLMQAWGDYCVGAAGATTVGKRSGGELPSV